MTRCEGDLRAKVPTLYGLSVWSPGLTKLQLAKKIQELVGERLGVEVSLLRPLSKPERIYPVAGQGNNGADEPLSPFTGLLIQGRREDVLALWKKLLTSK